jgi:hypothetical protein
VLTAGHNHAFSCAAGSERYRSEPFNLKKPATGFVPCFCATQKMQDRLAPGTFRQLVTPTKSRSLETHMKTTALLSVVALCASAMVAQGQSYIANLTPAQDGGGLRQGSGFATLVLSSTNTLKITGAWGGLSAPMTLGHIHGPSGPLPSSAAVIYDLIGPGILTGQGNTFGTYNGGVPRWRNPWGHHACAGTVHPRSCRSWSSRSDPALPPPELIAHSLFVTPQSVSQSAAFSFPAGGVSSILEAM